MLQKAFAEDKIEVGLDEAGRGCLAGPVFAAAVILDLNNEIEGLNDSKQISESERYRLEKEIKEKAFCYSVASCSNEEIDKINILKASIKAMHRAIDLIDASYDLLLIDGNKFYPYKEVPYETVVKGDSKFQSIAAASILAKCARDRFMDELHNEFHEYCWNLNKGYPTRQHREAIIKFGYCSYHRKSFKLIPDSQLNLFSRE